MAAFVSNITYALGDKQESVEDCAARGATISDATLLRDSGFAQHHICHQTTAYDLARNAVANLEQETLKGVSAIVYSTCIPMNGNSGATQEFERTHDVKHLMDFPASRLQCEFGLDQAEVIGLTQQACTGMLGSIRLASALLRSEPEMEKVLCITADRFPQNALYEQSYCLISDGAAACVVSKAPLGYKLLAHHGVTNGAMSLASDDEAIGSFFNYSYGAINAALAKAKLAASDINWVVPQNTNAKAWQILARLLNIDSARVFFPTLAEVGHVISGDNMINLHALEQTGDCKPGDKLLLFMAGYGLNWQCLILEKANASC